IIIMIIIMIIIIIMIMVIKKTTQQQPSQALEWIKVLQRHITSGKETNEQDIKREEDEKKEMDHFQCAVERMCLCILPFLRKCYILFYSSGLIQLDLDLLWSCVSVTPATLPSLLQKDPTIFQPEKVRAECDAICRALFLPTFRDYVATTFCAQHARDQDKLASLQVMQSWTHTFFERFTERQCRYIDSTKRIDSISPISLIRLPRFYDHLFKKFCKEQCNAGSVPTNSAICLYCGAFLCIQCCTRNGKGALTIHSKRCGQGKGIFLWLQLTSVLLIYEHAAILFPSLYLDSHGEEDIGMKRRNILSLSDARMHELEKLLAEGAIPNKVCQLGEHFKSNSF
ncbi:hypothetical protein RFI_26975, partial [Reticulomyxa filosa]